MPLEPIDLTGPAYPKAPGPGSNGIGLYSIGISPIGDIRPFDWPKTIISQYANSPTLLSIIEGFHDYVDQTQNVEAFYDLIMNLDTAQGYGLDVWGRIVGVQRVLQVQIANYFGFAEALPGSLSFGDAGVAAYPPAFGFAEALPSSTPFGYGTFGLHKSFVGGSALDGGGFYSGETLTSNYSLEDQTYRTLILVKAAANISSGSVPAINQILLSLFPNRGNCYVKDGVPIPPFFGFMEADASPFADAGKATILPAFGFAEAGDTEPFGYGTFGLHKSFKAPLSIGGPLYNGEPFPRMQMKYYFEFPLTQIELAIVEQSGVLPKPVGVSASVVINPPV